ncbi:MAG: TMEM165/GDT1 family protein [Chloroflexi bacterium]|nr:TMEM165/GDT1 family protein [Chloroflexota bacterium]
MSRNEELERLKRLRERQIQARDPKAKEKKTQSRVTTRRKHLKRRNVSFQYMMRDMLQNMSYKFWGVIIGALFGTIISIVLALFLDDVVMLAVLGLAITIILALLGLIFGSSFDWRDEVTDEFKDSHQ